MNSEIKAVLNTAENPDGSEELSRTQDLGTILKTNKTVNKSLRDIARFQALLETKFSDMSDFLNF